VTPATREHEVRVLNAEQLCSHGNAALRTPALEIATAGLAACDGHAATVAAVSLYEGGIVVGGIEHELAPGAKLLVLGAGKATLPIAMALEDVLGDRIDGGAIIVRRGETAQLRHLELMIADHPLPTADSEAAGRRLLELAEGLGPDDLVLACFTGGSSALASLGPEGVPLEHKRELHERLIGSGMPINQVNAVRKHVSEIKGGRLAERIAPARIVNLTVSDVAGNHLDLITDLTVPDTSTTDEAISILERHGLWDAVPSTITRHLRGEGARTPHSPRLDHERIWTELLVTGEIACEAMVAKGTELGLAPVILTTTMEGEAREMGRFVADICRSSAERGYPFAPGTVLVGCGGENSVALAPGTGFGGGGPGQEAAVAAGIELDGVPVAALFMDTDGSDGGTDAAGALADGETAGRARELRLDLASALHSHGVRPPLVDLDDLIATGPTGTNVNDLLVAVIGEPEA
jgi:glycerate-2-kinase